MGFIILTYMAVVLVTAVVQYNRIGFPRINREHQISWREFILANPVWYMYFVLRPFVWPLLLAVWLFEGRPETAWSATVEHDGREVRRIVHNRAWVAG